MTIPVASSILLIPIVIALIFIQIKISKSIHDSSKNNKQWVLQVMILKLPL